MTTKPVTALRCGDRIPTTDDFSTLTVNGSFRLGGTVEVDAYPPPGGLPLNAERLAVAVGARDCRSLGSNTYRLIYRSTDRVEIE